MLYFSLDDVKCPCDIPEKQTQAVAADATSVAPMLLPQAPMLLPQASMLLPQATKAPCGSNEAPPHAKCLCEIGGTQTQAIDAHASRQSSESSFRREASLKRPQNALKTPKMGPTRPKKFDLGPFRPFFAPQNCSRNSFDLNGQIKFFLRSS